MEKSSDNLTQDPASVNVVSSLQASKGRLIKSAGLLGLLTLCSRILGMIRDIVSARNFGTSWQWDAFLYSFTLPNFFRRIVGEGALSSAFIPVYTEILHKDGKDEAFRFANVTLTILGAGLVLFLLAVEIILNLILPLPGLPPIARLTLDLLRFMFPYLWFMSIFALGMGILNSHQHFLAPSLGPVILDIAWIAGVIWIAPLAGPDFGRQVRWLGVVILFSGAIQLAVELPPLFRLGFRLHWIWDFFYSGLKKTGRLFGPTLFGFAVVQLNILVDSTCGLLIGAGANSSLWYGNRLMQFPLGIFAIAMGTALLPTIANHTARRELEAARKTLSFALRSVFLIIVPASVGLIMLRVPIVQLLFERGQFDAASTSRTAAVLMCYSFGLFAYSGQKIITAGFYAAQNTRTPVKIGILSLMTNLMLNLILMIPLKEAGLALATSIAGILQFALLALAYHRKIAPLDTRQIAQSFFKIILSSLGMAATCAASFHWLKGLMPQTGTVVLFSQVFGSIALSIAAYIVFCLILRVNEMNEAFDWILRKKNGRQKQGMANGSMSEA